ncbi:DUF1801 domain-containing protein [Microbacterium sp. No. 7]|uniref:DUF1801 domain-containing protein n=1 Tax=Microbacterium sp. No. 7 TaxID=1714373 RepID=UPI0018D01A7C|nr:DUF1801 domain-containing protein [Microbacterium sp. No. 7]
MPDDILDYHARLDAEARPVCDLLLAIVERELPDADRKIWHAHPVWFFDGNPVVGYDRLKASVRLLFWSGQSFRVPGLSPEGTFRAAEARYTAPDQVDAEAVRRWLADARDIQWNYRDIRRNGGLRPLRGLDG